jgi:predicted nucleic acid-binding protein
MLGYELTLATSSSKFSRVASLTARRSTLDCAGRRDSSTMIGGSGFTGSPSKTVGSLTGVATACSARSSSVRRQALLADLVVAECVLRARVLLRRAARVAELMRAAIAFPTIETIDPDLLLRALETYQVDRLDFAEAYLVALAESADVGQIVSVDRVGTLARHER